MDQLAYTVGQEEAALKLFVGALLEEQGALKVGDTDRLEKVVVVKNRQLEVLTRLGRQRNQLLKSIRLADDSEGLRAWAKASGQEALIDRLLILAEEAKELNRLNGKLITMRLNTTQTALAALAPHRAEGQGLYGPKGQTKFSTGYRLIDAV